MSKAPLLLLGLAFAATPLLAQSAPAAPAPGTQFKVELEQKLDTKKAKVGDKVTAKVDENVKDHDTTILPKGTMLSGTITQVAAAEGKGPANLGVLFNLATTKQGARIPLRAAIVNVLAEDNNGANMLSRPTEMGGTGQASVMDPGNPAYQGMVRASSGTPVNISLQDTAANQQSDLGGVMTSIQDNFSLDDGAKLELRVLQPH